MMNTDILLKVTTALLIKNGMHPELRPELCWSKKLCRLLKRFHLTERREGNRQ